MNKPNRSVAAVAGAVAATFSHIVHMLICPVCIPRARTYTHTEHGSPLFNPLSRVRTRRHWSFQYTSTAVHALVFYYDCGPRPRYEIYSYTIAVARRDVTLTTIRVTTIPGR